MSLKSWLTDWHCRNHNRESAPTGDVSFSPKHDELWGWGWPWCPCQFSRLSPNSTWLVTSRHDKNRHVWLVEPMHFACVELV